MRRRARTGADDRERRPVDELVVLNACSSDALAEPLRSVVDCVIGMSGALRDTAALTVSMALYRALGNLRSVGNAVAQAIAVLAAKRLPDEGLLVCRTRDGISANNIFLPRLGSVAFGELSR